MTDERRRAAVVVPVFNPEPGLVPLCRDLTAAFACVVVVDDGSTENRASFDALPREVVRLSHTTNRGKGRAVKTAVDYLQREHPDLRAVVFADGDGQHALSDVCSVAERVLATDEVTFGVRELSFAKVPFRSWWGNWWTSQEIRLLFGLRIADTQTGLRGIPARLWPDFLSLRGERFEFEARLFRFLALRGERVQQLPIRTIYVANNRASHFRPIRDTLLTQFALLSG